jgi:hypothetical protein
MSDPTNLHNEAGQDPTRDTSNADGRHDARLEHQVVNLLRSWLRMSGEASSAHTEAALDRASFESFPASDPVAPAAAPNDRRPSLEQIDCTMSVGLLTFRCTARPDEPLRDDRPPPAWTIEGDAPGGGRLQLRVWVDDATPESAVPATLELEPVHASIRPMDEERRVGTERRTAPRTLPDGFDRRRIQRRAPSAGRADAPRPH